MHHYTRPPPDSDHDDHPHARAYERSRRHWRRGLTIGSICAVSFAAGFALGAGLWFFALVLVLVLAATLLAALT